MTFQPLRRCKQTPDKRLIWGVLILALLLVGCRPGGTPDPCAPEGTLFTDDFENENNCGWVLYDDSGLTAVIEEGTLRLSTSQMGKIVWTNPNRSFVDTVITVRTRQLEGPDDNAYGVICRYQGPEDFYLFLISGDGYYAIGKYESGRSQIQYLTGDENGDYIFSDAINQGQATNNIRAGCIGDSLSLSVNGLPLVTVQDGSFAEGDIGLGASTLRPGTALIQFDNVNVTAP